MRECGPAHTPIPDLQPPELGENTFPLHEGTLLVAFCHSSCRTLVPGEGPSRQRDSAQVPGDQPSGRLEQLTEAGRGVVSHGDGAGPRWLPGAGSAGHNRFVFPPENNGESPKNFKRRKNYDWKLVSKITVAPCEEWIGKSSLLFPRSGGMRFPRGPTIPLPGKHLRALTACQHEHLCAEVCRSLTHQARKAGTAVSVVISLSAKKGVNTTCHLRTAEQCLAIKRKR